MNCSQMKMLLPPYASHELSVEEQEMVELHLAGCSRCRAELAAITSLQSQLALLQTIPVDTQIADSVISKIKWRTTDTHAPESSMEPSDMLSTYTGERAENNQEDEMTKRAVDLPMDSEGKLIPDAGLQNEP